MISRYISPRGTKTVTFSLVLAWSLLQISVFVLLDEIYQVLTKKRKYSLYIKHISYKYSRISLLSPKTSQRRVATYTLNLQLILVTCMFHSIKREYNHVNSSTCERITDMVCSITYPPLVTCGQYLEVDGCH